MMNRAIDHDSPIQRNAQPNQAMRQRRDSSCSSPAAMRRASIWSQTTSCSMTVDDLTSILDHVGFGLALGRGDEAPLQLMSIGRKRRTHGHPVHLVAGLCHTKLTLAPGGAARKRT